MYSVGDKVVYPRHGAGKVVCIERKEMLGRPREYLTIQILHNRMTVMIPVENAGRAGLRTVIAADAVDEVLEVLRSDPSGMPAKWHARVKRNQEKLGSGDVFEVAEVVRDLAVRRPGKDLPIGEKQMLTKAQKILASELMYARDLSEEEATALLEDALSSGHVEGLAPADGMREPQAVA